VNVFEITVQPRAGGRAPVVVEYCQSAEHPYAMKVILREPCTPRLGRRARLRLDLIDDGEFETNVAA